MKQLTAKEVKKLLEEKPFSIIDVREMDEVEAGKIPGIIHIPLGFLQLRFQELDQSKEYIIVCRSGNRSYHASQFLESKGYQVINMAGGMLEWEGEVE